MSLHHMALAVFVAFLWGFFPLACKMIAENAYPPILMSGLRFLGASLPLMFFVPRPHLPPSRLIFLSLTLGFNVLFFMLALQGTIGPGLVSIIMESQVFFTAFMALYFLKKPFYPKESLAFLFFFMGILIIGKALGGNGGNLYSMGALLVASLLWAANNIQLSTLPKDENILSVMVWVNFIPSLPILGISWVLEKDLWIHCSPTLWDAGLFLFISLASGTGALAIWTYLMQRNNPMRVAPFALLSPIIASLSSALFFGETFSPRLLLAGLFIFSGLILLELLRPQRTKTVLA